MAVAEHIAVTLRRADPQRICHTDLQCGRIKPQKDIADGGVRGRAAALVLAHLDIDEKSNEIPAAQVLLASLGIPAPLVTLDAHAASRITGFLIRESAFCPTG